MTIYVNPVGYTGSWIIQPGVPGISPPIEIPDHTSMLQNALNSGDNDLSLGEGTYNTTQVLQVNNASQRISATGIGPTTAQYGIASN